MRNARWKMIRVETNFSEISSVSKFHTKHDMSCWWNKYSSTHSFFCACDTSLWLKRQISEFGKGKRARRVEFHKSKLTLSHSWLNNEKLRLNTVLEWWMSWRDGDVIEQIYRPEDKISDYFVSHLHEFLIGTNFYGSGSADQWRRNNEFFQRNNRSKTFNLSRKDLKWNEDRTR